MRFRFAWALALAAALPAAARADVTPHALCTDGMVLQQKAQAKVWGTADPNEEVVVTFRDKKVAAAADEKGNWVAVVDSGEAGGPFPMTIGGNNTLEYKDVYVGEVWVASGQSNMEWPVTISGKDDVKLAADAPANPKLRLFTVPKNPTLTPQTTIKGQWVEATPETAVKFSAVGYFFGRTLQEKLDVPVGVIHTSWGGTRAEAWTRKEVLDAHPTFKHEHEKLGKAVADAKDDPAARKKLAGNPNAASVLYNGMIAPLLNYTIRGAIWYQGESNAGRAYDYRTLFPLMIQNWRQDWKVGDFPFYFVQLAPFLKVEAAPQESAWAELREAQLLTLKLPKTGMAVITDLGSEHDIHPTPKSPVGRRLALIALNQTYGQKVAYSGPLYKAMRVDGNKAILSFHHVGAGLVAKELEPQNPRAMKDGSTQAEWRVRDGSTEGAALTGFTVAGGDGKFHPAKATIVGDTVVVTSDEVPTPTAVRYGWANHPVANLFNRDGLPASPFRTDTRPGVTGPKTAQP